MRPDRPVSCIHYSSRECIPSLDSDTNIKRILYSGSEVGSIFYVSAGKHHALVCLSAVLKHQAKRYIAAGSHHTAIEASDSLGTLSRATKSKFGDGDKKAELRGEHKKAHVGAGQWKRASER